MEHLLSKSKELWTLIDVIKTAAPRLDVRQHIVAHFKSRLKDPAAKGCTEKLEELLKRAFNMFTQEQIEILIEELVPEKLMKPLVRPVDMSISFKNIPPETLS
jgi:hypothetical protein